MRLFFALACLASPAMADCPTRADLRAGVTLVQNGDHFIRSDFEWTGDGLREVRIERKDGKPRQRVFVFAHGLLPLGVSEGRAITRLIYDTAPERLDALSTEGSTVTRGTRIGDNGAPQPVQVAHVHDGVSEMAILGCRYETWKVRETRVIDGVIQGERLLTYAPELGVVVAQEPGQGRDGYAYTWIGTAADVAR